MEKTCKKFKKILNAINEKNISSRQELMADANLYSQYWFAADAFASYCLASQTTTINDETTFGNEYKVKKLEEKGVVSKADIHQEAVLKLVQKLDLILIDKDRKERRPIEHQYNYAYTCINTLVIDCNKKSKKPEDIIEIPLQGYVGNNSSNEASDTLNEEIIGHNNTPENLLCEEETIQELTQILKAKRRAELMAKRSKIMSELECLSKKPAEVLVRMGCFYLELKPQKLAKYIIENGVENTYATILVKISKKYKIHLNDIRELISGKEITVKSLKADTEDPKIISAQISRLIYRANQNIEKTN